MFLEAVVYSSKTDLPLWTDRSTAREFIFESSHGFVKLQKRTTFPHTTAYLQNNTLIIGYGRSELGRQVADCNLQMVDEKLFRSDEFLYIEIDLTTARVIIQRDALSTLPIFVGSQNDRVVLSSRHSRVIELMDADQLRTDHVALIRYLCGHGPTHHTLFTNVMALHDRMRFSWKDGKQRVEFAPDASIKTTIRTRDGSMQGFRQQLEDTLEAYKERYAPGSSIACEWSGGIDSAILAGYFADQGYDVTTATMMLPGAYGVSQAEKHRDFKNRFTIADTITVPLDPDAYYFFHAARQTENWKSFYIHEPMSLTTPRQLFLEKLSEQGFSCIFTGSGGDELCEHDDDPYYRISERLDDIFDISDQRRPIWWTPAFQDFLETTAKAAIKRPEKTLPPVSTSIAFSGMCANNSFIEQGFWPVSPLADADLYAYCQNLPLRYRINKNALKMYHEARQTPASIYRGNEEDFCMYFYAAAASQEVLPILERFMTDSLLHSAGLIDKHFIIRTYKQLTASAYSESNWEALYALIRVLTVEISLQTSGMKSI